METVFSSAPSALQFSHVQISVVPSASRLITSVRNLRRGHAAAALSGVASGFQVSVLKLHSEL